MCAQSCLTVCDPDGSPPGSSVHGILQARIQEWAAISWGTLGDLPDPGIESPALAGELFTTKPPGKPASFTVGQVYILSPRLLDLLIKSYSGRNGLHQPFKKALSPSTRAMSAYLLRIFITERIYMKTLA